MGRGKFTQAEKDEMSRKATERIANKKKEKENKSTSGADPSAVGGGSDPDSGSNRGNNPAGSGSNHDDSSGTGGGGSSDPGTSSGNSRKIPPKNRIQKPLEVVVSLDKIFDSLPALLRLGFKALKNVLNIFNWFPFPFKIELEDLDKEEAALLAEATKPGIEKIAPELGKKHPIKVLLAALGAAIIAKLKFSLKPRKNKESEN